MKKLCLIITLFLTAGALYSEEESSSKKKSENRKDNRKEVYTEIVIDASKEKVWNTLVAFDEYPEWNPFIRSIKGDLSVGKNISITLDVPNQGKMNFSPKILEVDENNRYSWLGSVLFRGIFDGEHHFELEAISANKCRFVQRERFSGLLVGMMWEQLKVNTQTGFEKMNSALKERCESM